MDRRRTSVLLGLALAAATGASLFFLLRAGGSARGPVSGKGRSVLLVTLDTTRADRLGCYGYARARTPRLDRLAAEGVRFENAFADAPITLPSHASIFTALYPFEHGVRNNGNFRLAERFPTLATVLRERGYRTAAFVSSFVLDRRYGLARGFETYDDRMEAAPESASTLEAERRGDRTARALGGWLEGRATGGEPFFAWLHLYDAHEPYRPPPSPETFADPYDGEIAFADAALGQVLDRLRALGLLDRTLVAVVADHGESLGDHGEETHSMFVYDSVIRVPLVLWGRGILPAGRTVGEPVRTIDLAPTLFDLLEAPPLASSHARSLRSAIEGRSSASLPAVYAETYVPQLYLNGAPLRAVRDARYKLIDAPRPELYDMARDPGETRDRYRDEPKVAAALRAELERLTRGTPGAMSAGPVDTAAAEKLRALGYVGSGSELLPPATGGGKDPKDLITVFNRLRRADEAVRARRFTEALALLQEVKADDPRNAFARQLLGSALLGSRQYPRALEEFRAYAALVPGSAQAHQWMAVCHANLRNPEQALREAAAALALDPRLRDARLLRAGLLAAKGRGAEAAAELQAAVEADADDSSLRMGLAEMLAATGRLNEAEREYRRVVADDPALRDEARLGLAGVLERQGKVAEARAELERLLQSPDAAPDVKEAARRRLSTPRGRPGQSG